MSVAAILYDNLADDGVITTNTSITSATPAMLQDPHVARRWRGLSGTDEHILVDLGAQVEFDTIVLLGLNLTAAATTRVRASSVDTSGQDGDLFDTDPQVGAADAVYQCLYSLIPLPVTGRYVRIDMSDSSLDYIEAGRLVVGLRNTMAINFQAGWSLRYIDRARKTEGRGGQTFIDPDVKYRVLSLQFEHIHEDLRYGFIEELDRLNGSSTDILILTNPDSDQLGRDSIWGLCEDTTPIVQGYVSYPARFAKSYTVLERL